MLQETHYHYEFIGHNSLEVQEWSASTVYTENLLRRQSIIKPNLDGYKNGARRPVIITQCSAPSTRTSATASSHFGDFDLSLSAGRHFPLSSPPARAQCLPMGDVFWPRARWRWLCCPKALPKSLLPHLSLRLHMPILQA